MDHEHCLRHLVSWLGLLPTLKHAIQPDTFSLTVVFLNKSTFSVLFVL